MTDPHDPPLSVEFVNVLTSTHAAIKAETGRRTDNTRLAEALDMAEDAIFRVLNVGTHFAHDEQAARGLRELRAPGLDAMMTKDAPMPQDPPQRYDRAQRDVGRVVVLNGSDNRAEVNIDGTVGAVANAACERLRIALPAGDRATLAQHGVAIARSAWAEDTLVPGDSYGLVIVSEELGWRRREAPDGE